MQKNLMKTALSKTNSIFSLIFLGCIASVLLGGAIGACLSGLVSLLNGPAIFWKFGYLPITLLCGLLVAGTSALLIQRGVARRLGLERAKMPRTAVVYGVAVVVAVLLAYTNTFTASSQLSYFILLGIKTLILVLTAMAFFLVLRGHVEINLAGAVLEAREEGVSGEFIEAQGGALPSEKKDSVFSQVVRLFFLVPICLLILSFTLSGRQEVKPHQEGIRAGALANICNKYADICAVRDGLLYVGQTRSFEDAPKRLPNVLQALSDVHVCGSSGTRMSTAWTALSGNPVESDFESASIFVPRNIPSGAVMLSDPQVFQARYVKAISQYNLAISELSECGVDVDPEFIRALSI